MIIDKPIQNAKKNPGVYLCCCRLIAKLKQITEQYETREEVSEFLSFIIMCVTVCVTVCA